MALRKIWLSTTIDGKSLKYSGSAFIPPYVTVISYTGNVTHYYKDGELKVTITHTSSQLYGETVIKPSINLDKYTPTAFIVNYAVSTSKDPGKIEVSVGRIQGENLVEVNKVVITTPTSVGVLPLYIIAPSKEGYYIRIYAEKESVANTVETKIVASIMFLVVGTATELGVGFIADKLALRIFKIPELKNTDKILVGVDYTPYDTPVELGEYYKIAKIAAYPSYIFPLTSIETRKVEYNLLELKVLSVILKEVSIGSILIDINASVKVAVPSGETPEGMPSAQLYDLDFKPLTHVDICGAIDIYDTETGQVRYSERDICINPAHIFDVSIDSCTYISTINDMDVYECSLTIEALLNTYDENTLILAVSWKSKTIKTKFTIPPAEDITLSIVEPASITSSATIAITANVDVPAHTLIVTTHGSAGSIQHTVDVPALAKNETYTTTLTLTFPNTGLNTITVRDPFTGKTYSKIVKVV